MKNLQKKLSGLIYILSSGSFLLLVYLLFSNNVLPFLHRVLYTVLISLLYIVIMYLLFFKSKKNTSKIFLSIFLLILFAAQSYASNLLYSTFTLFENKIESKTIKETFNIYTQIDNKYNNLYEIGKAEIHHSDIFTEKRIQQIEEQTKIYNDQIKFVKGKSESDMVKKLYDKDINYLLIQESRIQLIELQYPDFKEKFKKLDIGNLKGLNISKEQNNKKNIDMDKKSYSIFISGGDNRGEVDYFTRSDVNMIVTFNTDTNEILLTSIPRDTYVKIYDRGEDKLTHAGIYGLDVVTKTIEELYGIKIDYSIKINFNSLIEIVDLLGGITVKNDTEFTSFDGKYFPIGEIQMDGADALSFVRERYTLQGGDLARGKNQQKVIEGMIKKAISPSILFNYSGILEKALNSVITDISSNFIVNIINRQIYNPKGWKVTSQQLEGYGVMGLPSYAMPESELSFIKIYEESLQSTKQKIEDLLKK